MTQKKLEIIGEYHKDHPGPFCLGDGRPVRILTKTDGSKKFPIVGYVGDATAPMFWSPHGQIYNRHLYSVHDNSHDLMNAREIPVAREFWVNEYEMSNGDGTWFGTFTKKEIANINKTDSYIRTIHVREVLPGEE